MRNRLAKVQREGYRVIYIDETVFTRKTVKEREWTASRSNLAVDLDKYGECLHAVIDEPDNGLPRPHGPVHAA